LPVDIAVASDAKEPTVREMVQGLLETGTPFKSVDFGKLRDKHEQFERDLADDGFDEEDNEEPEETDPQTIPAPTTTNRLYTHQTPVLIPGATDSSLKGNVLSPNVAPQKLGPAAHIASFAATPVSSYVLFDLDDHSIDNYVSNVQEVHMIAALGPRKHARSYTDDHALHLIRKFRGLGRHFAMEERDRKIWKPEDDNDTQDDGKGGLMTLSPQRMPDMQMGELDVPVRDMRYADQRDERFDTHMPMFEDED
jgi:hypothetical protein